MTRRTARTCTGLALPWMLAVACSPGEGPRAPAPDRDGAPDVLFERLEQRLLTSSAITMDFRITASDAVAAVLEGTLSIDGDRITLAAAGAFDGTPVIATMHAVDGRLLGGTNQRRFDEPVPPDLRAAILIGFTRMGLLHNLARLTAGRLPDRPDGTVRDWVAVEDVGWDEAFTFDIRVDGQSAGEAELWLDDRGLPTERRQTVRFPGGAMHVHELYAFR